MKNHRESILFNNCPWHDRDKFSFYNVLISGVPGNHKDRPFTALNTFHSFKYISNKLHHTSFCDKLTGIVYYVVYRSNQENYGIGYWMLQNVFLNIWEVVFSTAQQQFYGGIWCKCLEIHIANWIYNNRCWFLPHFTSNEDNQNTNDLDIFFFHDKMSKCVKTS